MKPNFSGDLLDRITSVLSPAASAIVTARLTILHDEPRFHCAARFASPGDAIEFSFERFIDARESAAASASEISRCYWDHDMVVSEDHMDMGGVAVVMTWRYELMAGGRRLRAAERIRGDGRDQDSAWEFERS